MANREQFPCIECGVEGIDVIETIERKGQTWLAKDGYVRVFANRTQAQRAADQVGGEVVQGSGVSLVGFRIRIIAKAGVNGLEAPAWYKGAKRKWDHSYGMCYQLKWAALAAFAAHNSAAIDALGGLNYKHDEASFESTNVALGIDGTKRACVTIGDALWESLQPVPGKRRTASAGPGQRPAWCLADIDVKTLNQNQAVKLNTDGFSLPDYVVEHRLTDEEQTYWAEEEARRIEAQETCKANCTATCQESCMKDQGSGEKPFDLFGLEGLDGIRFMQHYVTDGTVKQKVWYSIREANERLNRRGEQPNRRSVVLFAKDYEHGLGKIFPKEYTNDSDFASDYVTKDQVVLWEGHPLYAAALERAEKNKADKGLGGLEMPVDDHFIYADRLIVSASGYIHAAAGMRGRWDQISQKPKSGPGNKDCGKIHALIDKAGDLLHEARGHLEGAYALAGDTGVRERHKSIVASFNRNLKLAEDLHAFFAKNCVRR